MFCDGTEFFLHGNFGAALPKRICLTVDPQRGQGLWAVAQFRPCFQPETVAIGDFLTGGHREPPSERCVNRLGIRVGDRGIECLGFHQPAIADLPVRANPQLGRRVSGRASRTETADGDDRKHHQSRELPWYCRHEKGPLRREPR
jgi:hypothetical protein